jgi:hypothetical protein
MELPEGFIEWPQGYSKKTVIHCFVKQSLKSDIPFALTINRLGGTIPPDKISDTLIERMYPALPPDSKIEHIEESWKIFKLDGIRIHMVQESKHVTVYTVQIPLAWKAIQINLAGPSEMEEESGLILKDILRTLEGKSNWR